MRVLHVSPSFYPAGHYGGPTQSSYGLCNAVAKMPGVELRVLTTDSDGPRRIDVNSSPVKLPKGYDVYYCRRWFGADIAPRMFWRLPQMIRWADIVHLTAIYSPPTIPTLALCRLLGKPVLWSTRGALQSWRESTRKNLKSVWEKTCDLFCSPDRVMLHVTGEPEKIESVERIKHARAVVIPNGIESPMTNGNQRRGTDDSLRLLYLGRLHPIKGIENLLQALAMIANGVTLSVCGDGEADYQSHLKSLADELDLTKRVTFHGRVNGEAKEQRFAEADLCVVPSFTENFCNVVAESLARGVPVIASKGTPWTRVTEIDCGLWVDNDPETLARAIRQAQTMPLREMGERGRQWMQREFSWPHVAAQMVRQYETLIETNRRQTSRDQLARA
ncbi:MAG TPA: glycosyltransferase [Pyrinomonadaceae bacterium]|nr:glycosyltransferase [Pyrinomonadaceae bacterium]